MFKKLGDAAFTYVTTEVCEARRLSSLSYELPADDVHEIKGLDLSKIKMLCSPSVFSKSKRFETTHSQLYTTQSSALNRCITGQYRAATIHEQSICWESVPDHNEDPNSFNLSTILVYCTCKYFNKATCINGMCCSHIIGQLRRTRYLITRN